MLRSLVISRLGKCDDPEVVQEARKRFKNHCDGIDKLSGDLRNAVMHFKQFSFATFNFDFISILLLNLGLWNCVVSWD